MTTLSFNNCLVTIAIKGTLATIKRYGDGILNTEITKPINEAQALKDKLLKAGFIAE